MAEPFLGEIRMMGFNFTPAGWGSCDGQILPIIQNQSLYSLLGTTYGGDGRTSFALPDLRARAPIHFGKASGTGNTTTYNLGQKAGEESHQLTVAEIPAHTHNVRGTPDVANADTPSAHIYAQTAEEPYVTTPQSPDLVDLSVDSVKPAGSNVPHSNMQPFLTVRFCIAMRGVFPSRN